MDNRTCSVDGCESTTLSRGLCNRHYQSWRKTSVGQAAIEATRALPPRLCSIEGCTEKHHSSGYCMVHYGRIYRTGDPHLVREHPNGEDHVQWIGPRVGYHGAHLRVVRRRGSASTHICVQCGRPAQTWAYDHEDPNERQTTRGYRYSPDPERYIPMCCKCHKAFDREAAEHS